jgi:hypothetical protein
MDTLRRVLIIASLVLISTAFSACGVHSDKGNMAKKDANAFATATPTPPTLGGIAPILRFTGTGASPTDVAAKKS